VPEAVADRPTRCHEYLFLLTKSHRYFYDSEAIKEATSSKTPTVSTMPRKGDGTQSTGEKLNKWMANHGGRYYPLARNRRTVWTIPTEAYPGAHFATFPTRLVEPCILAGTSEYGCCAACGAPLRRKVTATYDNSSNRTTNGTGPRERGSETAGYDVRLQKHTITLGWQPSCGCGAKTRPCTVLDPFSGAGTTGLVALRHGRSYIGIELNPEYVAMSERRLRDDAPLLRREAKE
jgi:hypothetical protein